MWGMNIWTPLSPLHSKLYLLPFPLRAERARANSSILVQIYICMESCIGYPGHPLQSVLKWSRHQWRDGMGPAELTRCSPTSILPPHRVLVSLLYFSLFARDTLSGRALQWAHTRNPILITNTTRSDSALSSVGKGSRIPSRRIGILLKANGFKRC